MLKLNDILVIDGFKFQVVNILGPKVCLQWICKTTNVYKKAWVNMHQVETNVLGKKAA